MNQEFDHSRFDEIFGDQQTGDDVSLESALEARRMKPSKVVVVESYDTELGWVKDEVTVKVETECKLVAFLRNFDWTTGRAR